MIVFEVGADESNEMLITEDHDALEKLAAAAADPAFRHRFPPWAPASDAVGVSCR
jgi:hypothetical protein